MTTVATARMASEMVMIRLTNSSPVGPKPRPHHLRDEDGVDDATGDQDGEKEFGQGIVVAAAGRGSSRWCRSCRRQQGRPHQAEQAAGEGARGHHHAGVADVLLPGALMVLPRLGRQRRTARVDLDLVDVDGFLDEAVVGAVSGRRGGGSVVIGRLSGKGRGSGVAGEPLPRDPRDAPLVGEGEVGG